MAWEKRGNQKYYYRSERVGGRVRKQYYGRGKSAELMVRLEELEREQTKEQKQAEREKWRAEVQRLEAADPAVEDMWKATDQMVRAALLLAGYHQHNRGEWRRHRGKATEETAEE